MNGERYRVIFKGEIAVGEILEDVKERLSSEFKVNKEKIETLFSKGNVVIKKGAQLGTCEKIKEAFNRAGAKCVIQREEDLGMKTDGLVPPPIPDGPSSASVVNEGVPVKRADERFCENCGAIVKINSLACPVCGKPFRVKRSMPGCAIAAIVVAGIIFIIIIMGILAAIAIPNFIAYKNKAMDASVRMELTNVAAAEEQYYTQHNEYTTDLEALGYKPSGKGVTVTIVDADSECFEAVAELQGHDKELRIDCSNEIWEVKKSPSDD